MFARLWRVAHEQPTRILKPKSIKTFIFDFPGGWLKAELFYSPFFLTGEG